MRDISAQEQAGKEALDEINPGRNVEMRVDVEW